MSAKVISILNIKGGVGKSTITVNLAHALKEHGKSVLLIDLDLQSNLTDMALANLDSIENTIYDVLVDDSLEVKDALYESVIPEVEIVPSDLRLVNLETVINPAVNPNALTLLKERLQGIRKAYDYIFMDCRPDVDMLTMNALLASDFYMIPVCPDRHSVKGIRITDQYVKTAGKANRNLREIGILVNNFDRRTALSLTMYEKLREAFDSRVMDTVILTNVGIVKAAIRRETVFQFDRRQSGCESFTRLAREVLERVGDACISDIFAAASRESMTKVVGIDD